MSQKEIDILDQTLSNHEKFIMLASNPDYVTDEVFLDSWIKENNIDIEYESERTNRYAQHGPAKETALLRAIRAGNLELIELLIKKGVDLNHVRNSDKITPLMLAAYYINEIEHTMFSSDHTDIPSKNGFKILDLLIKSGADIDKGGVLSYWYGSTDNEIFNTLIKNLKSVNQLNEDGSNCFINQLARELSLEQYKFLHEKGADIHLLNKHNHNPIFIAAACERIDVIEYLLNHNVDLTVVSIPYKKNILEYLEDKKQFNIIELIKKYPLYKKLVDSLENKEPKNNIHKI